LIKLKTLGILIIILLTAIPTVSAQNNITPKSLEVKIFTDGSTLIKYYVESDPTRVRVDLELFGNNYNNLVIRDEDRNPLDFEPSPNGLTIDTIGASELEIIYSTIELTTKIGPIWNLNLTSPISAKIILPEGGAIFDLGDIPIDMGIINGAQYVELPPGDIYLSFLYAIKDLKGEADSAIDEVEIYITNLENQGYKLLDAKTELNQAIQQYENNEYQYAKEIAKQALETASTTIDRAKAAELEIALAETEINQARDNGRTTGLTQAEDILAFAKTYQNQGYYLEAETSAKQATQLASSATKPGGNTILYFGAIIIIVAAGSLYYLKYIRRDIPDPTKKPLGQRKVNLERLFRKHDDLRLEDREVLKFLTETNGEAFATEIRDRFDMPRSTAWRLIRRLSNLEIVEEVKIGNQSLVRIREEYYE
jgi:uncharacterized membrane protein